MNELTEQEKEFIMGVMKLVFSHPNVSFSTIDNAETIIALVRSIEQKLTTDKPDTD